LNSYQKIGPENIYIQVYLRKQSPSGVEQESIRSAAGVYQELSRSPSGVEQESIRSATGVHQELGRSPSGVYQDLPGVHQDPWGSVNYRFL
jgi:hypothetical protein